MLVLLNLVAPCDSECDSVHKVLEICRISRINAIGVLDIEFRCR